MSVLWVRAGPGEPSECLILILSTLLFPSQKRPAELFHPDPSSLRFCWECALSGSKSLLLVSHNVLGGFKQQVCVVHLLTNTAEHPPS